MKMLADKISSILNKIMLTIFVIIFGGAVILGVFGGIEYKSYPIAFAAAVVLLVYLQVKRKYEDREFFVSVLTL